MYALFRWNQPSPYETADGCLQTTEGCSHNTCLFCTYFKDQKFRKSTIKEIEADIQEIPVTFGAPKRIFLQGADGSAADYDVLMKTAELLRKYVPSVKTIGGYGLPLHWQPLSAVPAPSDQIPIILFAVHSAG